MIQVRRSTYRGTDGFTISGRVSADSSWPVKVFEPDEKAARWIADRIRNGEPWTFEEAHQLA